MVGEANGRAAVLRLSRFWLAGCYVPPADGEPKRWDMQVQFLASSDGAGVVSGIMTHQLTGEVRTVQLRGGGERRVQTFRYVQADGSSGILLLCGCCGRVAGLRSESVDLGHLVGCDACGAAASASMCRAGHAFGSCALCDGRGAV